ncbi:Trk system potassium transporter TrkA [Natrinema thermotolerans]|uniref:Trk system potassium transporter TrkA n=1 Tax=Natrinema thermotolerans TaxID=121872 RepID=A0AAF0T606_9EURY|nr:Trk system potassium transporter TrkA [Natrinema thermotolerans]QCC60414.1 Trk system potassium transporter TrkA [Natrinema thermotolerans]QCC61321.1 Trk system potassium transporter TrkA [Natrinema thermotolerans]WMT07442.1 Trk system potassium transporter TrkA [Natrinema thermotolerans]WMT08074.1 Trk system potassium transporter TrkA [Natrinema thermotolerans]
MYVIIVGAGEVGRSIAANLEDGHDVVVIDRDANVVEELTYSLDVLTIRGDGTDLEILREADLERAELVIACTDNDETNAVVCGAAKAATDVFTVARVRRRTLLETWQGSQGAFGVDFMVCTDLLTARAIFRISGLPSAHDVDTFAGGLVRMAEFDIPTDSPIVDLTVSEADCYDSLTFAAIFRDDEMIVTRGDTHIRAGDRVVVIGSPDSINEFADEVATKPDDAEEVVIVGGSEVGYQAAREFEDHGFRPRLIERDHERAREIAESLPNTMVMESDATNSEFLAREHVGEADVVVAALDSDEKNLLVSLLADRLGVDRTVAIIENPEYADLFETVGIDVAINPREETAEEIIRFTRTDNTEKIAMLEHDRAEVIEIEIGPESVLAGREIVDATDDLPPGVVIGAISRSGDHITPRGSTVIEPGDHVIVFVDATVLDDVLDLI